MRITPGIFKAYDIRGIYPTELDEPGAHAIGRAFVTLLGARRVIVGHDMRLSGPALFAEVTRGIMEQGADVINIGLVSTDQFYFACARLGLPGMMVTASHNPKHYNGFKMVRQMPYLLSGNEGIQDLRRIIEADAFAPSSGQGTMSALDLSEAFIETLLGMIDVTALAGQELTVVADTGNGTVGPILRRLYARLPVTLIGLYLEPDGNLPNHGLDPLQPENRAELERRVITAGAAAGFAFDGDGDRDAIVQAIGAAQARLVVGVGKACQRPHHETQIIAYAVLPSAFGFGCAAKPEAHAFDAGALLHVLLDALRDAGRRCRFRGTWSRRNLVGSVNGCTGGQGCGQGQYR